MKSGKLMLFSAALWLRLAHDIVEHVYDRKKSGLAKIQSVVKKWHTCFTEITAMQSHSMSFSLRRRESHVWGIHRWLQIRKIWIIHGNPRGAQNLCYTPVTTTDPKRIPEESIVKLLPKLLDAGEFEPIPEEMSNYLEWSYRIFLPDFNYSRWIVSRPP